MGRVKTVSLKPLSFQAVQYDGSVESGIAIFELLKSTGYHLVLRLDGNLIIGRGGATAQPGQWFVKNNEADFDVVSDESFRESYDIEPEPTFTGDVY